MHLLAASMLFGLILASVPIIIHLLNRRRFQLLEWAPMKYLKLTIKTNRRRMRIEQLLLLIVRTLAIVLLFIGLSRPALSRNALGKLLSSRARISRVIVLDDSLSMGYQVEHRAAFDNAKEAASQIIRGIGAQDAVTVMLVSRPDQPLVQQASLADPGKLLSTISMLTPADSASDWPGVFKRVDEQLNAATHPQKEVLLLTDLRRSGWAPSVGEATQNWASQSIDLRIIDIRARQTENIVLARLEQVDPIALAGVPLRLRAIIRNDSPAALRGAQAALEIDGQSRPLLLPDVAAGQSIEVPLTLTPSSAGQHVIRLTLPPDALPADQDRRLVITARDKIEVALIDGQIGNGPFESSTDFLSVAFTSGTDPWQVTRRSDSEWQRQIQSRSSDLGNADVIVLANVASPTPQQAKEIESFVSGGSGLMIFGGEQVDPQLYDERLYRDGTGVLPARISRAVDEPANGLIVEGFDDSPLLPLTKIAPGAMSRVRARKFFATNAAAPDSQGQREVRVLARWNDAEAHPAVIEKRFGRGRALLWTVSADRQWSDWPVDPTYVLAVRSAAMSIARPDPPGDNFTAGQPIAHRAGNAISIDGQPARDANTTKAGTYKLTWKDDTGAESTRTICANFDIAESDLDPMSEGELTKLLSPLSPTIVRWSPSQGELSETGREIWRFIAATVLALLIFETAFAVWVGRER